MSGRLPSFYETITAAVNDMASHGYDSVERVAHWVKLIKEAALRHFIAEHVLVEQLRKVFSTTFTKLIDKAQITRVHPGMPRFTIDKVRPQLHAELNRRIAASQSLIKLNREEAVRKAVQRFEGWATSIPMGGSSAVEKVPVKVDIKKSLAQLPFEERRVLIDQGHKFTNELSNIIAVDGGAIAAKWHSHYRQAGYDYREDHKERDYGVTDKVYTIRGNWAIVRGLMRPGAAGYTDDITKPGEEVFCRCKYEYVYALRDLPDDMITQRGVDELERARAQMDAMR